MPSVKKTRPIFIQIIDKNKALVALDIYAYELRKKEDTRGFDKILEYQRKEREFQRIYQHSYNDVIDEMWRCYSYLFREVKEHAIEELYTDYVAYISQANSVPTKLAKYEGGNYIGDEWVFKGYVYEVKGFYSDDEIKLLILEDFDKERRYFEKLSAKFNQTENTNINYERPRIPEGIRIEVWRRDSGRCARCGSRERLEYDHIVPISKGGSNTARNIELLCEKCNRSKSNNVV